MSTVLPAVTLILAAAVLLLGAATWHLLRERAARSRARVAALADAIEGTESRAMFAVGDEAPSRRPLMAAAAGAVVIAGIALVMALQPSQVPVVERPLELLAMRHVIDGASLSITGVVRNPSGSAPATRITAVVNAYDREGTLVATGRAALDYVTLQPGQESPFVVTLQERPAVERYRVTFRTEQGIIRHVDRRS